MVTLECSFKKLKELTKKDFLLKELENILLDLGFELDDAKGDDLKIDITSERPDAVSVYGLSRILRNYFEIKSPDFTVLAPEKNYDVFIDKSVEKVRPYTVCAIVKKLSLTEEKLKELIWIQEKIHSTFGRGRKKTAIGIYPLEKIKLPIYFKADKPEKIVFRPLESSEELNGFEILEKHKAGREFKHLMEGLDKYSYFVDSGDEILSMPPIINSHRTGKVTVDTKEIFIECSGHNLESLKQTLNLLVYIFVEMGGVVYSMNLHYPDKKIVTPDMKFEKRKISKDYVKQISGLDLNTKELAKLLKRAGHKIIDFNDKSVDLEVHNYRTDIWHDVDLIDDVLKIYGINNVEPKLPKVATHANVLPENRIKNEITELMIGLGFQEVFTLSLTNPEKQYIKMNTKEEKHIKLGSTVEQSISMLRTWLLPCAIETLHENRNTAYPQKLFEINDCVIPNDKKDVKSENVLKMSCLIADADVDFTKIKQTLIYVLETIGFSQIELKEQSHGSFIEGRCAKVLVNKKEVGFIGEINPQVLDNWDLEVLVSAFELNLSQLFD